MPPRPIIELLFTGIDTIERMLEELETTGSIMTSRVDLRSA